MDIQEFYSGNSLDAYKWFGAHRTSDGKTSFLVFAPAAQTVELVLNDVPHPMRRTYDGNFHEAILPDVIDGDLYEYRIHTRDGRSVDHCDPYGTRMELRPAHRTIVAGGTSHEFHDSAWMEQRTSMQNRPLNIYEMHLGSWRRKEDGSWYTYDEIAPLLIPYLKESGYNYVEFLPLSEHPLDESWGYQTTGFFAPTSRYGSPEALMSMIDEFHKNGIGVIADFVPVHFAADPYGLGKFDGEALYEYPHVDVGESEWGSYNFMHSRGEVRSFLQSAANYWLHELHFDGLRMDAISRIIYWQGDENRGVNGNAVDFLKCMNRSLKEHNPGCILIAEDSTNYYGVTRPVDEGGLGFDYKWDMGWMHDTLEYFQTAPEYRSKDYNKLTFSMMYFYNEHYLLPFSHDEVVHGKATILQKMSGGYEEKFPQGRALYMYMIMHPGKKLNFMGNEIGQLREWDENREQDWSLRNYPAHDSFYHYMAHLNNIYLSCPALYEMDYETSGFRWLDCNSASRCTYAIERSCPGSRMGAVFNFSSRTQTEYHVPLTDANSITVVLNTDWDEFGGLTPKDTEVVCFENGELVSTLAPFSSVMFEIR